MFGFNTFGFVRHRGLNVCFRRAFSAPVQSIGGSRIPLLRKDEKGQEERFELAHLPPNATEIKSLVCLFSSFNPIHLVHEYLTRELLQKFEAVGLIVVPDPLKIADYVNTATMGQRLEMLLARYANESRVFAASAPYPTGLPLIITAELEKVFPKADIHLAMNQIGYNQFLLSKEEHIKCGYHWTEVEEQKYKQLHEKIIVWLSSRHVPSIRTEEEITHQAPIERCIHIPQEFHGVSSGEARELIRQFGRKYRVQLKKYYESSVKEDSPEFLREKLRKMISEPVLKSITEMGLYRE